MPVNTLSATARTSEFRRFRLLLFVVNNPVFFRSHRFQLALAAQAAGIEIAVASPVDDASRALERDGVRHIPLPVPRGFASLWQEWRCVREFHRILRRERPAVVHLITSRPIILGGLVARLLGVPLVAAVSGLGHLFIDLSAKSRILRRLVMMGYRAALNHRGATVIFQNGDDRDIFIAYGAVSRAQVVMIKGSGAALELFDPSLSGNAVPVCVLPARMLWSKGVGEFVEAARQLRLRGIAGRFLLLGDSDKHNPAGIPQSTLDAWVAEGVVEWQQHTPDIAGALAASDIVVLPSHREGFPKTLVDAAAAGRASVTTDVPGCRDAVVDGETGLLARVSDAGDLADKMELLLTDPELRLRMGRQARALAERDYDVHAIAQRHLSIYRQFLPAGAPD